MHIKKTGLHLIVFLMISYMGMILNLTYASEDEYDDLSTPKLSSTTPKKSKKKNRGKMEQASSSDISEIAIDMSSAHPVGGPLRLGSADRSLVLEEDAIIQSNLPLPSSPQRNLADDSEDLLDDVPGCEDNYYRCCLCCFRISRGWIDALTAVALVGGAITTGLITYAHFSDETNFIIGNVTAGFLVAGAVFKICKAFVIDATASRTEDLRTVVRQGRIHRERESQRSINPNREEV